MSLRRYLRLWWLKGVREIFSKATVKAAIYCVIAFTSLLAVAYALTDGPKGLFSFLANGIGMASTVLAGGAFYLRRKKNKSSSPAENAFYLMMAIAQVGIGTSFILTTNHAMAMITLAITAWVVMAFIVYVLINIRKNWQKASDTDFFTFPIGLMLGAFVVFLLVKALPDHWAALLAYRLFP
jgi:uncharacterized membrane protein